MINNDVIRSIRFMLDINELKLIEIAKLDGGVITPDEMKSYLKKIDEPGFVECSPKVMTKFLNGLIYFKRGKDPSRPPFPQEILTNNVVLKKLRVAFELKDDDIVDILKSVDFNVTATELGALFRKVGHRNYRECGDQFLRNFLKGLTLRLKNN